MFGFGKRCIFLARILDQSKWK